MGWKWAASSETPREPVREVIALCRAEKRGVVLAWAAALSSIRPSHRRRIPLHGESGTSTPRGPLPKRPSVGTVLTIPAAGSVSQLRKRQHQRF